MICSFPCLLYVFVHININKQYDSLYLPYYIYVPIKNCIIISVV